MINEATTRIMAAITELVEELRGGEAPAERFDPRKAGVKLPATPTTKEQVDEHRRTEVAVFGAGSWGTAFSMVLADAGNDVTLWARREELAATINATRENPDYLPGIAAARRRSSATHDPEQAAADADVVVLAVPSQTLRDNLDGLGAVRRPTTPCWCR